MKLTVLSDFLRMYRIVSYRIVPEHTVRGWQVGSKPTRDNNCFWSVTAGTLNCMPTSPVTSSSYYSPLCTSITPFLFHSRLKTNLFHKSYPRSFTSSSRTASTDYCPDRFFWAIFLFLFFSLFFSFLCRELD